MKVSIIIPAYNLRNLLTATVESALAQSHKDIEIIIVDDGSTDGTAGLADTLALKDDRIRVFHIPNGGVGMARRHGVLQATGEWVFFSDGDDLLPPDAIKQLVSLDNGQRDLISGWVDAGSYAQMKSQYEGDFTPAEYARILMLNLTHTGPWGKLIRRSCIDTDLWQHGREIYQNEDMFMLISTLPRMKGVHISNTVKSYLYQVRPGTVSQSAKMPISGWIALFDKIKTVLPLFTDTRLPHIDCAPDSLNDVFTLFRARRLHKCVIGKRMTFRPSSPELKPIVADAHKLLVTNRLNRADRSLIRTLGSPMRIAVWQTYLGLKQIAKRILKPAR